MALRRKTRSEKVLKGSTRVLLDPASYLRSFFIAVIGLAGAAAAFALAISGVARTKGPDRALAFVPWEGDAIASKADLMVLSGRKVPPENVAAWARAARRNAPLNAKAVRLLGMSAGLQNNENKARALMTAAAGLTRRDAITQIFMVEVAAKNGDLKGALAHYDAALRTSPVAPQILYPRLVKAIQDPRVRAELKPYVRSGAVWTAGFFDYAKDSPDADMSALVDLLIETGGISDVSVAQTFSAKLIDKLAERRDYSNLKRYFVHLPGAQPTLLTQAAFSDPEQILAFGAAAWKAIDDAESGASTSREKGQKRVSLSVYANSGTTRLVAQKLLFLPPGQYRFYFGISLIEGGKGGSISWYLRCMDPAAAQPFWRLEAVSKNAASSVDISPECQVQQLQLYASGGQGQGGLQVTIGNVALVPADGAKLKLAALRSD